MPHVRGENRLVLWLVLWFLYHTQPLASRITLVTNGTKLSSACMPLNVNLALCQAGDTMLAGRACQPMIRDTQITSLIAVFLIFGAGIAVGQPADSSRTVLHAARLLDIESGKVMTPGEVLVEGERITAVGPTVKHPAGAQIIDLGDRTLLPGLIDAHVHLFL